MTTISGFSVSGVGWLRVGQRERQVCDLISVINQKGANKGRFMRKE